MFALFCKKCSCSFLSYRCLEHATTFLLCSANEGRYTTSRTHSCNRASADFHKQIHCSLLASCGPPSGVNETKHTWSSDVKCINSGAANQLRPGRTDCWNVIITTRYVSISSERCPTYQALIPHQSSYSTYTHTIYSSLWGGGEYGSSLFNEGEESEFMTFLKMKDRCVSTVV